MLLTWIKASKEDHTVGDKTQARTLKADLYCHLCTCPNRLLLAARTEPRSDSRSRTERPPRSPLSIVWPVHWTHNGGYFLRRAWLWLPTLPNETKFSRLLLTFLMFCFEHSLLTKASLSLILANLKSKEIIEISPSSHAKGKITIGK